jgi:hypothetical protein
MLAIVVLYGNCQTVANPPNPSQLGVMAHREAVPAM